MKNCIRVYADQQQIQNCKDDLTDAKKSIHLLSRVFSLAGNEVRLKILYTLWKQDKLCVCDLSDVLEMSIPAVSQHLRKLKDGNVISCDRVGQTLFYKIEPAYNDLLEGFFKAIKKNEVLTKI